MAREMMVPLVEVVLEETEQLKRRVNKLEELLA